MPAHKPEEVHRLFADAFNAGDVQAILSLYEPDAVLVPQPGQVVQGQAAIRAALGNYLALKPKFTMQPTSVLQSGEIALLFSKWTLSGIGPDGKTLELAGQTTDVMRRRKDGTWLIVIDNPFGVG
ncbi:MAG: SgcJ/EcaC family oxidoreductase [Nitrospirae bacterium]|nr:SgcJ/EcaC family oxidoreductase [Nitrospirota bacterium]